MVRRPAAACQVSALGFVAARWIICAAAGAGADSADSATTTKPTIPTCCQVSLSLHRYGPPVRTLE